MAELHGFPQDLHFYALGMNIYDNRLLYVINHAYDKGGERVEVFTVEKDAQTGVQLTYKKSIRFPDRFAGMLNDIVAIGEDEFYISHFMPTAHDINTGKI